MSIQLSPYYRLAKIGGHAADWRLTGKSYGRGQLQTVVYDVVGGYEAFSIIGYTRDGNGNSLGGCTVVVFRQVDDAVLAIGVSDGGGYYRFDNTGAGPFYIVAFDGPASTLSGSTRNGVYATPAPIPAVGTYSSNFPGTENPISQGGIWNRGFTEGIDWQNIRTTPGLCFGVGPSGSFDDCTADLKPSYGISSTKHYSRLVIRRAAGYTPPSTQEVATYVGATTSANVSKRYETLAAFGGAIQLVRWNGALNDVTLNGDAAWPNTPVGSGASDLQDSDVLETRYDASTGTPQITVYVNNVQVYSVADTSAGKLTSGQPGLGFFARSGGGLDMTAYCAKAYDAGTL